MATIKSFTEDKPLPPKKEEAPIDMDVLEYFYAATIYEILEDDGLVKLIDNNGFYKTSFCEAFNLKEITITIDGKDVTWYGPPESVPSNYHIFEREYGKVENINDVHMEELQW